MKLIFYRELPKFYLFCEKCEKESMILFSSEHCYTTNITINIYICQICGIKKQIVKEKSTKYK